MSQSNGTPEAATRELARLRQENEQLRQRLSQLEEDRNQYLQNVSHQLVTPLNAIKWHIENLTESRVGVERAKKVLRSVYSQATIAVHLAKNFRLMSNLEADHDLRALKEPLQEVELCRLLINLADDFQPLGWDSDIHIKVLNARFEHAPPVLAMKPLISQVFSNILENAIKYSDPNTEIVVEGLYRPASDAVETTIRNRGIPLRPEHYMEVFQRGFRSADALRKYPAGTGFGLYIAQKIVQLHQGSISASSVSGWTLFTVGLPVRALAGKARYRA